MYGYHGVFDQERRVGAEYELDVDLDMEVPGGCTTDDLADAVSYADVYEVVKAEFARPSDLLEHLVARISHALLERWPQITVARVRARKLAPPIPGFLGSAAVTLTTAK